MSTIKTLLLCVVLILSNISFSHGSSKLKLIGPELAASNGNKYHINDFTGKGQWTTLIIWGPKCPACIEEMPEIQGLYDDIQTHKINVLGLAVDFPTFNHANLKQVQEFEEDYFISFPNLLISADIYNSLGIGRLQGTPTTILVDPDGYVSAVQLGGVPKQALINYINKQNTLRQK